MTRPAKPTAIGDDALGEASGGWRVETSPDDPKQHLATGWGGDDYWVSLPGQNMVDGKGGNDTLIGGEGYDNFWGEDGNDSLEGGGGPNYMHGGAGDDTIATDASGHSTVYGGSGTDTVVLDCGGAELMEFRHALVMQLNELGIGCRLLEDGSIRLNYPAGFEGPLNLPGNVVAHDVEQIAFR